MSSATAMQKRGPNKGNRSNMGSTNSGMSAHSNSNVNNSNKPQSRPQKMSPGLSGPSITVPERTVSPEGIYYNGRVMHVTSSLIGCVVQVEVKDGHKYEGVLRTFSPEFELVLDTVAKVEPVTAPSTLSNNIGNLLTSLHAKNSLHNSLVFKYSDVVKLTAVNVDLNFAASKANMMIDTEISKFDQRSMAKERELVPWESSGDYGGLEDHLDDHGSVKNGWNAEDMFKTNEERFDVRTTYDPKLIGYTVALQKGEGEEYNAKEAEAQRIAREIECNMKSKERYAKELDDGDEEEKYSAVHRTIDTPNVTQHQQQHSSQQHHNKPLRDRTDRRDRPDRRSLNVQNSNFSSPSPSSSTSSGPPPGVRTRAHAPLTSPPFHQANKNVISGSASGSNAYNKQQFNSVSSSSPTSSTPYQQPHKSSHISNHSGKEESPTPSKPLGYAGVVTQNYAKVVEHAHHHESIPHEHHLPPTNVQPSVSNQHTPQQLPQRTQNERRERGANQDRNKRREDVSDLKKFSSDFKISDSSCNYKNENLIPGGAHSSVNSNSNLNIRNTPSGVKTSSDSVSAHLSAVSDVHIKDNHEKSPELKSPSQSTPTTRQQIDTNLDNSSSNDNKLAKSKFTLNPNAKEFTLNPNAKVFTPRSPLVPGNTPPIVNPAATPPSISSTPSSTVSSHMPTHINTPNIPPQQQQQQQQQQQHQHQAHQQHTQHQQQHRPIMQIQPQYITQHPGMPLGQIMANQYFAMPNVTMTPPFTQPNVVGNQNQRFRGKGPPNYANHGQRHDFSQQPAHVQAATGQPLVSHLPSAIAGQQLPVSAYANQANSGIVTQAAPQTMYQNMNMYAGFHPRMNVNVMQHMGMMQPAIQYDQAHLQHLYATGQLQLSIPQNQVHQHQHQHQVPTSGNHSTASTPQSAGHSTPTTPLHGAPTPPMHPNQPPTPTQQQQTVMYAGVPSPHQAQNAGHTGNHGAGHAQYHPQQILTILPQPQVQQQHHHAGSHGAQQMHHQMSHASHSHGNHAGPPIMPIHLIPSNQGPVNVNFAPNPNRV